MLKLIKNRGQV